jgi:hypothetical protein
MLVYLLFFILFIMSLKPAFATECRTIIINGTPQPKTVHCHTDVVPNEGRVEVRTKNNSKADTIRTPEIITVVVTATPTPTPTVITYPTYNVKKVIRFTPTRILEPTATPSATRIPSENKELSLKPVQQKSNFLQNVLHFFEKMLHF